MNLLEMSDKKLDVHTGVGLGNFDGLHVGHMSLINTLISESQARNLSSVVYTFINHPDNVLKGDNFTLLLIPTEKKVDLLRKTELDYLVLDEFSPEFSKLSPEEFFYNILMDRLNAKLLVAGFDYRFGYKGKGDAELLKSLGRDNGIEVIIIPPVMVDNEIVSSTFIRDYIRAGNIEQANKMLGRYYSVLGNVEKGRQLGGKLGFPTANIHLDDRFIIPSSGVYITLTKFNGGIYRSITNVGFKPTVEENMQKANFETHILDFNNNIYNEKIEVFFLKKIRNEQKFSDLESLKNQVARDIEKSRRFFARHGGRIFDMCLT